MSSKAMSLKERIKDYAKSSNIAAQASATIYSITETARANELN